MDTDFDLALTCRPGIARMSIIQFWIVPAAWLSWSGVRLLPGAAYIAMLAEMFTLQVCGCSHQSQYAGSVWTRYLG
jgi:hypothetical protein